VDLEQTKVDEGVEDEERLEGEEMSVDKNEVVEGIEDVDEDEVAMMTTQRKRRRLQRLVLQEKGNVAATVMTVE
jgi:predicted ABC-type ATPase